MQLAIGDEFNAGDYTVVVTDIISGSPAGWKGRGFVKMKLVAGITLKRISVNFENAVVNECYELASGSVATDYDPDWSNVLDLDPLETEDVDVTENQGEKLIENNDKISDILEIFDCSEKQRANLIQLIAEQDALATRAQGNDIYTDIQKASIASDVEEIKLELDAILACCAPSQGARVAAGNCIPPSQIQSKIKLKNSSYTSLPEKEFQPLIIFVNGHHAELIPGPSLGGVQYWNYFDAGHKNSAELLFKTNNAKAIYADGSSIIGIDSDFKDRRNKGKEFVNENFEAWRIINGNKPIYIIGHSEGCAMAAGIGEQLVNKKRSVKEMILLSCDEGREKGAFVNSATPTYQLEYMYWDKSSQTGDCEPDFDWIIGTDHSWRTYAGIPGVTKFGIITTNLGFGSVHGTTGNLGDLFLQKYISELRIVTTQLNSGPNGTYYSQSPAGLKTKFYKIGGKFIMPNHPQWNSEIRKVDLTLPCWK